MKLSSLKELIIFIWISIHELNFMCFYYLFSLFVRFVFWENYQSSPQSVGKFTSNINEINLSIVDENIWSTSTHSFVD
jgi:hypothetical protein